VIGGLSVLALIPARGGSKGLPRKNILPVNGRPLIEYTVDAARGCGCIDRIVMSTDDPEIAQVAVAAGCEVPFLRPAALSGDKARSVDVVLHALDALPPFDIVVLLQPTSPARSSSDIDACCQRVADGAPACVSVVTVEQSPYWMFRLDAFDRLHPLLDTPLPARRQDLPDVFMLNGAVYAARTTFLHEYRGFIGPGTEAHRMPRERSIDIDTVDDLQRFARSIS
jgi:CMP-N,N'-diacetyllegionaminic acid synthase